MRQPPPFLCAILALLTSCGAEESASAEAANGGGAPGAFTFPVTFVPLVTGDVEESVELVGDVETMHRAELAFERAGRVIEITCDSGDEVQAGAVLARLDASVITAELAAARAAERAASADADHATAELQRAQKLGDTLAQSERDRWKTETAVRTARAAQATAEVARLVAFEEQCTLHAPFDGVLVMRHLTLGSHAQAGTPVFELVDAKQLEIRLELPASLAASVREGETVRIAALGGADLTLPLLKVLPSADPGTRTFRALLRPDEATSTAAGLRPGGFVRAHLVVRRAVGAMVVPRDALMESPQGTTVMLADLDEGGGPPLARLVPVAVLARDSDRAAIRALGGDLIAGTAVLVTGNDNVFPGAPLRLQEHRAITPQ
ncbi:MAG: efflux RND transporter periplasmic adaptor subunit [Planctomycetota bacterium]|nr:efflux RND transporter periplasmic adaptor subunit [Planctomycetota bacterium]